MYACHLAQVVPTSYSFSAFDVVSVNGSSISGRCSSFTNSSGTLNCTDPTSSVLFDGHIPILTGLDGDTWASQLLTLLPRAATTEITFYFSDNLNLVVVEVVMFNCPQWGIGVQNIIARENNLISIENTETDNITSCDYLVRSCIKVQFFSSTVSLRFSLPPNIFWIHLAEIIFHTDTSGCPPDTTVTGTSPVPFTTSTTSAMVTLNTNGGSVTTDTVRSQPTTPQAETSECFTTILCITNNLS